jgi:hypothetical protein
MSAGISTADSATNLYRSIRCAVRTLIQATLRFLISESEHSTILSCRDALRLIKPKFPIGSNVNRGG